MIKKITKIATVILTSLTIVVGSLSVVPAHAENLESEEGNTTVVSNGNSSIDDSNSDSSQTSSTTSSDTNATDITATSKNSTTTETEENKNIIEATTDFTKAKAVKKDKNYTVNIKKAENGTEKTKYIVKFKI
jgi:hypothetical protein